VGNDFLESGRRCLFFYPYGIVTRISFHPFLRRTAMACGKKTGCMGKTCKTTEPKKTCGAKACKATKKEAACKACGMAIASEKECGTNADGTKNCMYCVHCFKKGKKQ
jgi:hypothetical protein